MPARNSRKEYLENGFYHLYNRGVEKRIIFSDEQDYAVFLSYLKEYLLPKDEFELRKKLSDPTLSYKEKDKIIKLLSLNNFADEISLLAYCLMQNHFHFFIQQKNELSIDKFMQSLCTRYTMYFNRKYRRVGSLFQAVYKAVLITNDEQLLHLSRYIHKQAISQKPASKGEAFRSWKQWKQKQPSSFSEYIGLKNTSWVKTDEILNFFTKNNRNYRLSYEAFVIQNEDFEIINKLLIE